MSLTTILTTEVVWVHCRHSASSRGPRLLEEILRWGTTQLFDASAAASREAPPTREVAKPQEADEKAEAMDVDDPDKAAPGEAHSVAEPLPATWQSASSRLLSCGQDSACV